MKNSKDNWIDFIEKPSLRWIILGGLLIILGVSKGFQIPGISHIVSDDRFRFVAILIGAICLIPAFILSRNENLTKPNNSTSLIHLNLASARDHLLNEVLPEYRRKTPITLSDKKDAMAAILRMISLTTIPSTKENLARIGLFEVMKNGRFRILASHHIDAHRLLKLENLFSHDNQFPKGVVGHSIAWREPIQIPDLKNPPERYAGIYEETDDNKLPTQKARSILVIPVYRNKNLQGSEILAALSTTTSIPNYFTKDHEQDLEEYVNIIRTFLDHFETSISFNPLTKQKFRIITISGQTGSGKTTLAENIQKYLGVGGWNHIVIGELFREHCKKKNIDIERHPEKVLDKVHEEFDIYQKKLLSDELNIIVEGRMSGYFANELGLNDAFKIYCDLPLEDRVKRFSKRLAEKGKNPSEAKKMVTDRDNNDIQRYKRIYGIQDFRRKDYYDLYLNMNDSPEKLSSNVFEKLSQIN